MADGLREKLEALAARCGLRYGSGESVNLGTDFYAFTPSELGQFADQLLAALAPQGAALARAEPSACSRLVTPADRAAARAVIDAEAERRGIEPLVDWQMAAGAEAREVDRRGERIATLTAERDAALARAEADAADARDVGDGYMVRKDGSIWCDGKPLIPYFRNKGYLCVSIWRDGARRDEYVHRIVAGAWCEKQSEQQTQVNHRDGDPTNNAADNLEWCSPQENSIHAARVLFSQTRAVIGTEIATGREVTFRSIAEAKDHGFKPANIDKCLKGIRKHHGGYTWRDAAIDAIAQHQEGK